VADEYRSILKDLGVSKLWDDNPERYWQIARPYVYGGMRMIAPSVGYGNDRMPAEGGLVIAANHFGTIDPPLVAIHSKRAIYYMSKLELLSMPLIGDLLRHSGAFVVRRGEGDRDSIRLARWLLGHGHVVGIFMEGTRQEFGYPGEAHPGAAMLAIREGVPVIPCGLDSFQWRVKGNRRNCCVVWGEPLDLSHLPARSSGYKEGSEILDREVLRLWRAAAQAVVDGFPDVLPDGTPRTPPYTPRTAFDHPHLPPWPKEPWAEATLGPLFNDE
jgi:1-acyl-sn-glycerol-3-phosphate acyltransferase